MKGKEWVDLVSAFVEAVTQPHARPDVMTQTVGQGLQSVAALISSLHTAARDQFHAELGVLPADCPVCVLADRIRRRDRLYPMRLDQVEAVLADRPGRPLSRMLLLEILIEVDKHSDRFSNPDPYRMAQYASDDLQGRYPAAPALADIGRVATALKEVRGL